MEVLARTPLFELHQALGARLVPFAGYEMPVQYREGILKEHLHVREQAGLFDVSHMGQFFLRGETAAQALEQLVPTDVTGLAPGRQRYTVLTNDAGGVRDDLMVANLGDGLLLVVNAACKADDEAYLRAHLGGGVELEHWASRGLLALQGPGAAAVMARFSPEAVALRFMQVARVRIGDADCIVSRSGYTGEDGFEISVPGDACRPLAEQLLAEPGVAPIGLGARDSLRLEAGLCLYGHELDTTISPIEAGLTWTIPAVRRPGGARAGSYPGADRIATELAGQLARVRIGLRATGRAPVREGSSLQDAAGRPVGVVTSGGFAPSVGGPIAMAMVVPDAATVGAHLFADVRGKPQEMEVVRLPFVPHRYLRG